jgi:hypothetical protein
MLNFTNKIALVFLFTKSEYEKGFIKKCLDAFFENEISKFVSVDLFFFFNKGDKSLFPDCFSLSKHKNVHNCYFHSFNYSESLDIYCRSFDEFRRNPKAKTHVLGGSGGANLLFYDSFISLLNKNYENYLLLESDSKPVKNQWLDELLGDIKSKSFLIYGSTYKGIQKLPDFESWTGHLNGIAVYRNNQHLKHLLIESRKFIAYNVKHNINKFISFDVGIWMYTQTLNWINYLKNNNINFKPLIDSEVISNYSLYTDINLSESEILKRNPKTIILHQKWN